MKMHTNRHHEAKLLPPDTFLSQKCVCGWSSAPDPAGGAYTAPPDILAGNGGGAPGKGEGKGEEGEGREGVWRGGVGREGEELSTRTKILATALTRLLYFKRAAVNFWSV